MNWIALACAALSGVIAWYCDIRYHQARKRLQEARHLLLDAAIIISAQIENIPDLPDSEWAREHWQKLALAHLYPEKASE